MSKSSFLTACPGVKANGIGPGITAGIPPSPGGPGGPGGPLLGGPPPRGGPPPGGPWGLEFLREFVGIRLALILLALLLVIARSRGRCAPFLGILWLAVLVLFSKLVEALTNSLDL